MLSDFYRKCLAVRRFQGYRPQPVTFQTYSRWIRQFKQSDRKNIAKLLSNIVYISEADVKKSLIEQNAVLMRRLEKAGVSPDKIIYVQVHDAGSSSPVMLNMLRDAAGLEQRGCRFLDSNNSLGFYKTTNELGSGALIYVDDFVGSGNQFSKARAFAAEYIAGSFSEFLLSPCVCEEGLGKLGEIGVEPFAGHVHAKVDRPLHENSNVLDPTTKRRLIEVCEEIDPKNGLGYKKTAAMVVLYRNAPNNLPVLFRGNETQKPFVGILPRTTDLPLLQLA